jgi:hypothetical protein
MANLLRLKDYARSVQSDNLLQIIESTNSIRLEVEQSAQEEMASYLSQRYITSEIFTDTTTFLFSTIYFGKNLVEYTETAYNNVTVYVATDRVSYNGYIYESIAGSTGVLPTVGVSWLLITENEALYYAKLPQVEYSNTTQYLAGSMVWYKDSVYTANYDTVGNVPTNTNIWSAGTPYTFTGFKPDNTTYWTKGDNRNQLILMYLIDITLYHLHARINPRNTPELRMIRYDGNNPMQNGGAIAWLKRVAGGELTANLPIILAEQGNSIRYGSNIKNTNVY